MHDDIILGLTGIRQLKGGGRGKMTQGFGGIRVRNGATGCLLYTSDAADEERLV